MRLDTVSTTYIFEGKTEGRKEERPIDDLECGPAQPSLFLILLFNKLFNATLRHNYELTNITFIIVNVLCSIMFHQENFRIREEMSGVVFYGHRWNLAMTI